MRAEINSNDSRVFLELLSRFEFDYRRCGILHIWKSQTKKVKSTVKTFGDCNIYKGTEEFGETRRGNIDFRLQGLPHSAVQKEDSNVQKQDDVRRETVTQIASR